MCCTRENIHCSKCYYVAHFQIFSSFFVIKVTKTSFLFETVVRVKKRYEYHSLDMHCFAHKLILLNAIKRPDLEHLTSFFKVNLTI